MDYYHFPDYEPNSNKEIAQNQNIGGDVSNSNVTESGRDTNINSTVINFTFPSSVLTSLGLSGKIRLHNCINYLLTLLLLFGVFVGWFFLGLFSRCEFPLSYILEVTQALFGVDDKSKLRSEKYSPNQADELNKFNYLHNQDSQIWLLNKVISILANGKQDPQLKITEVIEILEEHRDNISEELGELKNKYYPHLVNVQKKLDDIFSRGGGRDLEVLQKIIRKLIRRYTKISRKASYQEITSFLKDLDETIKQNRFNINPVHLRILNEIKHLAIWLLPSKKDDKSLDIRVWIPRKSNKKNKFHFNTSCRLFPRKDFSLEEGEIKSFASWKEAQDSGYEPCETCKNLDV